jgi:hypothetical protein
MEERGLVWMAFSVSARRAVWETRLMGAALRGER